MNTIYEGLLAQEPTSDAIYSMFREPLSYGALTRQIQRTASFLRSCGLGRGDRVGIVLPNGPEMGTAFLSIASCSSAAPLNPGYREDEFKFYLSDLKAGAIVIASGMDTPARLVAEKMGILVIELTTRGVCSGEFDLNIVSSGRLENQAQVTDKSDKSDEGVAEFALPDDIALILHTSGTTSRPKIVPLTQSNLIASAGNIVSTLQLNSEDRGLNIMPLFHIHGLIASLLAPLTVGSSVVCSPGFDALKFFGWLRDFQPTWYSAVPTMHQAILSRAQKNRDVIKAVPLRFIRSSSSSIPPQVIAEVEETFGCPLIESYGMTEASHQMASNPLPPLMRKPGTVGLAAGPEIAVMSGDGLLLKPGEEGEIVIKGANVTTGYEGNPVANQDAFTSGWFRTGDQGVLDGDGYLRLTGRLKEIINRGGEKVSPKEVDEILMDYPAIAQVVTFGIPHEKLGEEVGAVVVLREGRTATEDQIRDFAKTRLVEFKVPRTIIFLDEIPKGATGKLQRIGLAVKLGLA
jgi:oxalate---CoA ligase